MARSSCVSSVCVVCLVRGLRHPLRRQGPLRLFVVRYGAGVRSDSWSFVLPRWPIQGIMTFVRSMWFNPALCHAFSRHVQSGSWLISRGAWSVPLGGHPFANAASFRWSVFRSTPGSRFGPTSFDSSSLARSGAVSFVLTVCLACSRCYSFTDGGTFATRVIRSGAVSRSRFLSFVPVLCLGLPRCHSVVSSVSLCW